MKSIAKWLLVFGLAGVFLVSIYMFWGADRLVTRTNSIASVGSGAQITSTNAAPKLATVSSSAESGTKKTNDLGKAAKTEVIKRWLSERGAHLDDIPEYKSYSDETLEKLAESGDIRALAILADKYERKYDTESQRKAAIARTKAAVYGSTYALAQMASHSESMSFLATDANQKKSHVLESMAWKKVSVLRGYPIPYFLDLRNPYYKREGVSLNESDFNEVNLMAQRMLDELQAKRQSLGLNDFDNSVPEIVQRHFYSVDPRKEGIKGY